MDYLPLGLFGKAPCDLEYIEHDVNQASSRKLKHWIRDGFNAARLTEDGQARRPFREDRRRAFVTGLSDGVDWVVGVLGPSTDRYPRDNVLSVFARVPRRAFAKRYHLLPMALGELWNAIDDARSHLLELMTLDAFRDYLKATRVPVPIEPDQVRHDYEQRKKESVGRVFERQDGASLARLQENLPELFKRVKSARGRSSVAVELPVSRELSDVVFEIAVWIDLVNRQFLWRKTAPDVFIDLEPGERDRTVVLVFGDLDASHYAPIMANGLSSEGVLRPALEPPPAGQETLPAGAASDPPSFDELLSRKYA